MQTTTYRPMSNNFPRQIYKYPHDLQNHKWEDLWVFGPSYHNKEMEFRKDIKKNALKHVMDKSQSDLPQVLNAMRSIEGAAKEAYSDNALQNLQEVNFPNMMAQDGCFVLLLGFTIIGVNSAGREVNFPDNHPIFGLRCVCEKLEMWVNSMFLPGNQIPSVVLDELMKLDFFQKLKTQHEWRRPLELFKRALHEFLIMAGSSPANKPVDLIHSLQLLIVGTEGGSHLTIPIWSLGPGKTKIEERLPSARQLSETGIKFKILKGEIRSRGIHYERGKLGASLHLPVFRVERFSGLMITCLRQYESVQFPGTREIESEASSYFRFLSDMMQTTQDVEFFASQGVIEGPSEGLLELLRESRGDTITSQHLLQVQRDIRQFPPFWCSKHLKLVAKVGAIFGFSYLALQILNNVFEGYNNLHP